MIVGVGCDIVEIKRIDELLAKGLAQRILTDQEYQQFKLLPASRQAEWLAGRFAAKEAVYKALPQCKLVISQIEITAKQDKPVCMIDEYQVHLSIAHEKEYAIAYAICEQKE